MRLSEATHLTIQDIDSHRMMLRIACGKGRKERHVPLSPRLLAELRQYWVQYRPTHYLFPGKTPEKLYVDVTIQKAMKKAALKAGIKKRVYPHVLRHSYATGLLEAGVDLMTISKLLGHASFITTMVYLHCRQEHLGSAPSPLDWLPVKQLPTYQPPAENQHPSFESTPAEPSKSDPPPSTQPNSKPQHSKPPEPPANKPKPTPRKRRSRRKMD